jgi:hypothetical protein
MLLQKTAGLIATTVAIDTGLGKEKPPRERGGL